MNGEGSWISISLVFIDTPAKVLVDMAMRDTATKDLMLIILFLLPLKEESDQAGWGGVCLTLYRICIPL